MLGPMVLLDGDPSSVSAFPAVAGGSRDQIVDTLRAYSDAGLDHALTMPAYDVPAWDIHPERQMEAMAELSEIVDELR